MIKLDKIKKTYPSCKILNLVEVAFPGKGWVSVAEDKVYVSENRIKEKIETACSRGAVQFNFIIEDEYGTIRRPDFLRKELEML